MKVTGRLKVGVTPSGIAYNKKYKYQVITNRDANTLEIYNEDDDLVKKIETGNHPFGVYSKDDFAYVANVYDDSVSIINLVDWSKYEFMVGAHPYNVRVHNKIAYVTNTIDDTITIYDLEFKKNNKNIRHGRDTRKFRF